MSLPPHFQAIEDHLDRWLSPEVDDIVVFDEKESTDFHLDVYWIKPTPERNYHILLTNGVSSAPLNTPSEQFSPYIELAMLLPSSWSLAGDDWKRPENFWPLEHLKRMGRYPHQNKTWFGFGHSVPVPDGRTLPNTRFVASVLLRSKTLPKGFQSIPYGENTIEVLLVFPLFQNELTFTTQNGVNSLIDRLQEHDISDILDVERIDSTES